jgi:rod shape determining protein RodA
MATRRADSRIRIDWPIILIYLVLAGTGIMSIFATTLRNESGLQGFLSLRTDYSRQTLFLLISLVIGTVIVLTDSKFFTTTANLAYVLGILLLLLVFPFHTEVKGTRSILRFGGFQLQPAELCKVFVNLALAKYLARSETDFRRLRDQLVAAAFIVLPALLCILQSETGLALVYLSFFLVMYRQGMPSLVLILAASLAALGIATLLVDPDLLALILTAMAATVIWLLRKHWRRNRPLLYLVLGVWVLSVAFQRFAVPFVFDRVLKPYQVQRIYSTVGRDVPIDPDRMTAEDIRRIEDRKKATSYNVNQSKIAIGSGGWTGKGLLKGTQTRYDFVPEQRTDFIFCTIGEGFGFLGSAILLILYLVLLWRIVNLAERQRSVFSTCYAYGVASVIFFHVMINIGMTVGLVPVIGIPLPFMSYGGTALLTFSILLAILIRLDADRNVVLK